jgi:lambda family phage portal protein
MGKVKNKETVLEVELRQGRVSRAPYRAAPGWWERVGATLDNAIGLISPGRALRRQFARNRRYAMQSASRIIQARLDASDAADVSRLTSSWPTTGGSADADILDDLAKLRARSRELVRNNGHASGIIGAIVNNVVGTGIRVQSQADGAILGLDDDDTDSLQDAQERVWKLWARRCDAAGRLSLYALERQVCRQILENGEAFLIRADVKGRPFRFAWMPVEADRIDSPPQYDHRSDKDIRKGIEIGSQGEPIAYWVLKNHPGDDTVIKPKEYTRIPAFDKDGRPNVLHIFDQRRPGQRRGVPFLRPAMAYFKHLSEYLEAELVAARVAACFALIINEEGDPAMTAGTGELTTVDGQIVEALEPGMILRGSGISPTQIKPDRPGETFDPFVKNILRTIAAGCEVPYELVAKDFSQSNYSNMRGAFLEARRFFRVYQQLISDGLVIPSWELVQEEAFLRGMVDMPGFYENRDAYLRVSTVPPGWEWVDPKNEVEAALKAIAGNIATQADTVASHGGDGDEVLRQRAREKKKAKELGLEEEKEKQDEGLSPGTDEQES